MRRTLTLIASLVLAGSSTTSAAVVISTTPVSQTTTASAGGDIIIDFDEPLSPATVNNATFRVFGRWSGPAPGTTTLENGDTRIRYTPAEPFFTGEWVNVMLSHGVGFAGGDTLSSGFVLQFWIASGPGVLNLTQIDVLSLREEGEGHIQSYGAYAGDLDDDGYSDLAIPNEISVDVRVCHNDGAGGYGSFVTYDLPGGASPSANEGADFNNDGFIDLAVANGGNSQLSVMMGNSFGGFLPATNYTSGNSVRGVAVLDLDADGDEDLVTANRVGNHLTVFTNNGSGGFDSSYALEVGLTSETSVAAADANGDGIMDLFVGSHNGQQLAILLGDGAGNLTHSQTVAAGGRNWMLAVGDVDLDGDVDVASANSFQNNTSVAFCDGQGGFDSVVVYPGGVLSLAVDLGDIDGDGDLDMVTSHYTSNEFIQWENDGQGVFVNPISYPAGSAGSCAILHDRDNDGDMDMSAIDEVDDLLFLLDNQCPIPLTGDLNQDQVITSADIIEVVNFLFKGFLEPVPCAAVADVNCSNTVTSADVIEMVNFVFKGGPAPCVACTCP
jgi:hypothetical protein